MSASQWRFYQMQVLSQVLAIICSILFVQKLVQCQTFDRIMGLFDIGQILVGLLTDCCEAVTPCSFAGGTLP